MRPRKKIVFYDPKKKRWSKIKKITARVAALASLGAVICLFSVFYIPHLTFTPSQMLIQNPKDTIDAITTQQEKIIQIVGRGPLLLLDGEKDEPYLTRPDFQKEKVVILTFDDGPDPVFTPKILEILKGERVKAAFFVTGQQLFHHSGLAKKIIKAGHQIGSHTFSHPSEQIDLHSQQDRMAFEFDFTQKIIQAQTGYKTKLFRVPNWGTENTLFLNSLIWATYAFERGYTIVSSTSNSFDWQEKDKEKIINNSVNFASSQIILMHDGGSNRSATVDSLPEIINRYQQAGYEFKTLDVLLEEKAMIQVTFLERAAAWITYFLFWLKVNLPQLLGILFKIGLGAVAINILVILAFLLFQTTQGLKEKNRKVLAPFVSVLVPAYNEGKSIGKTIRSILNSNYPRFEIIVINNNSQDKTVMVVKQFKKDKKVKLVHEKKQGKFAALNKGIKNAKGEILVVIDADTQLLPQTISALVQPFSDPKVGAVAGNLKVGNLVNFLTAFQAIEYVVSLNLDRRAYDFLTAVPVVPGALGAWRRRSVQKVGGYQQDTLTEDADLTIRIQKLGFRVAFAKKAVAYTEAPESIDAFLKQRLRWTLGMLQVLYKHRHMNFNRRYGPLGMVVLPYLGLIQLPLMLLSPFVDLLAFVSLIYSPGVILTYFLGFLILKYILTLVAFILARETKVWLLIFLPAARIFYQGLWYYTLYCSVLRAIKGVYVPWMKLAHKGNVTIQSIS